MRQTFDLRLRQQRGQRAMVRGSDEFAVRDGGVSADFRLASVRGGPWPTSVGLRAYAVRLPGLRQPALSPRSLLSGVSRCPETGVAEVLARLRSAGGCVTAATAARRGVWRGGMGSSPHHTGRADRDSQAPLGAFPVLPHQGEWEPGRRAYPGLRLTASMALFAAACD